MAVSGLHPILPYRFLCKPRKHQEKRIAGHNVFVGTAEMSFISLLEDRVLPAAECCADVIAASWDALALGALKIVAAGLERYRLTQINIGYM